MSRRPLTPVAAHHHGACGRPVTRPLARCRGIDRLRPATQGVERQQRLMDRAAPRQDRLRDGTVPVRLGDGSTRADKAYGSHADRGVCRLGRLHLWQPLVGVRGPSKEHIGDDRREMTVVVGVERFDTSATTPHRRGRACLRTRGTGRVRGKRAPRRLEPPDDCRPTLNPPAAATRHRSDIGPADNESDEARALAGPEGCNRIECPTHERFPRTRDRLLRAGHIKITCVRSTRLLRGRSGIA